MLDGERVLLFSGAVHYTRVLPEDWGGVLDKLVELGLNTVQTYVMWNFHEHERGTLDWSGRANMTGFVQMAQARGLHVVVRIGPYVCGEYYFGGIPLWLRHVDNVSCFRCSDPVWERETARFVGEVVAQLSDAKLLWDQGGPVIMLQIENEYGGPDMKYLQWTTAMAQNLTKVRREVGKCSAEGGEGRRGYTAGAGTGRGEGVGCLSGRWKRREQLRVHLQRGWLFVFRLCCPLCVDSPTATCRGIFATTR